MASNDQLEYVLLCVRQKKDGFTKKYVNKLDLLLFRNTCLVEYYYD